MVVRCARADKWPVRAHVGRGRDCYHAAMSHTETSSAGSSTSAGRILLVCYGNLCRSPMAEGLLRERLPDDWEVASAGTNAIGGDPPTGLAREVMLQETGIDIGAQRSAPLTVDEILSATHILAMSGQQAHLAAALVPEARARIRLLGAFAPDLHEGASSADPGGAPARAAEIADPIGGTPEEYLACLRRLERAIDRLAEWLVSGADPDDAPPSVASPRWPFRVGHDDR